MCYRTLGFSMVKYTAAITVSLVCLGGGEKHNGEGGEVMVVVVEGGGRRGA